MRPINRPAYSSKKEARLRFGFRCGFGFRFNDSKEVRLGEEGGERRGGRGRGTGNKAGKGG